MEIIVRITMQKAMLTVFRVYAKSISILLVANCCRRVTLERDGAIVLIKNVPADVCTNCGHYYLSEETARAIMQTGNDAIAKGAELEVVKLKVA